MRSASAFSSLDKARTITEALGDSRALADLANAKGALAEEQGDYRAALDAFMAGGMTEECAKLAVTLIAKKAIPAVSITY